MSAPARYWTLEFCGDDGKFLGAAFAFGVSDKHAIEGLALVGQLPIGDYDCMACSFDTSIPPPEDAMFRLIGDPAEYEHIARVWAAAIATAALEEIGERPS